MDIGRLKGTHLDRKENEIIANRSLYMEMGKQDESLIVEQWRFINSNRLCLLNQGIQTATTQPKIAMCLLFSTSFCFYSK